MAVGYDMVVIGSGPGGYTGAIRAAQLGWKVACIERETQLGGTCLRIGCIPSKALLESSARYAEVQQGLSVHGIGVGAVQLSLSTLLKRKTNIVDTLAAGIEGLFKKHRITRYHGQGSFAGREASGHLRVNIRDRQGRITEVVAPHVLIATGSQEAPLAGVALDHDRIGGSSQALGYSEVPGHLVVIGAGAIGLELGLVWRRLGAQVTVLEYSPRILPGMDTEIATAAQRLFVKQGLHVMLGRRVKGVHRLKEAKAKAKEECVVEVEGSPDLTCDCVLVATGRVPYVEGLNLESIDLHTDERGRIPVDTHFATSQAGVFAIGDVIAGPMLAHKAEEEAVACIEHLICGYGHVNYDAIAYIVYTEPEVAGVGQTEDQLQAAGVDYRKGSFPFLANARARALGDTSGFVKILADRATDRVLGVHILGARASELMGEAAAAIAFGASSEDIARVCHAHPTLSEAVKEAALAVDGRTLNL